MPLRKHDPVSDEQMQWVSPNHSICQVLREIYFTTEDPGIKMHCRVATAMAKAMTKKLKEYKDNWEEDFWEQNKDFGRQLNHFGVKVARKKGGMQSRSGKVYDVAVICENDWANSGWRYSQCLRLLGLNVIGMKIHPHPFFYPEALATYPGLQAAVVQRIAKESHVTVLHNTTFMEGVDFSGLNVVAQHGGRVYRQHHKEVNEVLNPIVKATIIQCPDLLGLGAKNEHWISFPVDTEYIQPVNRKTDGKLKFGHFPSHPEKGTAAICEVVESFKDPRMEYIGMRPDNFQNNIQTWNENLRRLAACDVYIECLYPKQGSMVFGEFGNQALECAAMGKIVITNCAHAEQYVKEYGQPGLIVANTQEELADSIRYVLSMTDDQVATLRRYAREWVVKHHSMKAVSQKLWDRVYRHFFEEAA